MLACACLGIGELLVALYLGGSLIVGYIGGRVWRWVRWRR